MHAVIMAGGKGTRLRPYTTALPKPLVPIGDSHAILEVVLHQLSAYGFTSATLAINHLGQLIRAFVGDGSRWGIEVDYVEEHVPLSTIGPLFGLRDRLPEHFLVMNGDVLTDLDYSDLLHAHAMSDAPLTVATARRTVHIDFGVLDVSDDTIVGFREKPEIPATVSMGIYLFEPEAVDYITKGSAMDLPELIDLLLGDGHLVAGYPFDGYWLDIGRHSDYQQAIDDFERMRAHLLPEPPLRAAS